MTLNELVEEAIKEWKLADREQIFLATSGEVLIGNKLFDVYCDVDTKGIIISLRPKKEEK